MAMGLWAGTAAAAEPAILYIPTEPIVLLPLGPAPCGSTVNSALGCGAPSDMEEMVEPYADVEVLTMALDEALGDYDVMVTNSRPPEYVAYLMLLPSDTPDEDSQSFTCTATGINCGSRQRNDIAFTFGATMNCMSPEVLHVALYSFGRASGLEGVANPGDYMSYVPDFGLPPAGFLDVCSDRVQQIGFNDAGMQVELPLECTSVDHVECPDDANGFVQQNSHQDLLLFYGPRTEDTDPPVLTNVVPADTTELPEGGELVLDVDITDADPVVGVRWVISSEALEAAGVENGRLSMCTNEVCDVSWDDATPLKATDSDFRFSLVGVPAGEYTITLEAADFHGNVAEMITNVVTVGEGGIGDTGDSTTGPDDPTDPDDGSVFTTGEGEGEVGEVGEVGDDVGRTNTGDEGDSSGSTGGLVLDRPGCACTTREPGGGLGWLWLWLGVLGLGAVRRRR